MAENGFSTLADLSRASGVDATTIGRWVRGEKDPTIPLLRSVAPHLGVRLGDLLIRAGLATAAELGTIGAPPPPRAPLPPQVQRVLSILLNPRVPEQTKATLLSAIDRTTDIVQEMADRPAEPQMRRKPSAKR
jgi:transcriptional regulator with XRE-family HTH domain